MSEISAGAEAPASDSPLPLVPAQGRPRLVARVVIDSPVPQLDHLFDYSVPDELRDQAAVGVRVTVPLRSAKRVAQALIVELSESAEFTGSLSPIESVVSVVPVLTPEVWAVARKLADRAAGTANDILRLAIPGRQVRVEKSWLAVQHEAEPVRPARTHSGSVTGYDDSLTGTIDAGGRIALDAIPRPVSLPGGECVGHWAVTLAELAAHTLAGGRTAIIAVPDYRDLDQLHAALGHLVDAEQLTRVDARQSNAERYRSFLDCLDGSPRVIVGNRSAIYAPAAALGLIVVWDDGDALHQEQLSPYVHARDAALVRQEQSEAALVFAAHSRSVEVQRLVELGWLAQIAPARFSAPKVIVTATQDHVTAAEAGSRIPSSAWRQLRESLANGPVLVQVARPGYAPVLACAKCQHPARCTKCHGPLGVARAGATPSCGWCGAVAAGWRCDRCEATAFRLVTRGTGRTAEELGKAFPGVKIIVADGERTVTTIDAKPALVVATRGAEPIADGGYAAILLLDGERMLQAESLRIAEDCLRWWSNAAALGARGAPVLLVGVAGPVANAIATWSQPAFAGTELADRRELRFPPAIRVASLSGDAAAVERAIASLDGVDHADVLGPTMIDDGVRAIVRFDYGRGAAVAEALRAAVISNATSRRKAPPGKTGYRQVPTLRVRFDDPEILS